MQINWNIEQICPGVWQAAGQQTGVIPGSFSLIPAPDSCLSTNFVSNFATVVPIIYQNQGR
jgi:hypothetical protein